MCAKLLQVDQIGVEDNFFELGGHSSCWLLNWFRESKKHFEIELPLRALFEKPTVAGLATAVERAQKINRTSANHR